MRGRACLGLATLIAAGIASSAFARDLVRDQNFRRDEEIARYLVRNCVAAATGRAAILSCVGAASVACRDPAASWPHDAVRDCAWREADIWYDIYLDTFGPVYLTAQDAGDIGVTLGLMVVETQWPDYAFAECRFEASLSELTPTGLDRFDQCRSRMYAERAAFYLEPESVIPADER